VLPGLALLLLVPVLLLLLLLAPVLLLLLLLLLIPVLLLLLLLPGLVLARQHRPTSCLHLLVLVLVLLPLGPCLRVLVLLQRGSLCSTRCCHRCATSTWQEVGVEPLGHGICMLPHGSHSSCHGHAHPMEVLCCSGRHLAHLEGGVGRMQQGASGKQSLPNCRAHLWLVTWLQVLAAVITK
jgi:hypothetical protein